MSNLENPFGEFDEKYQEIPKATTPGRIPPGVYKAVLVTKDRSDQVLVDHEVIDNTARSGSKGLKVFFEIIEPEEVSGQRTKGEIAEKVWWITEKTLPFIKRDVETLHGKPVSPKEFTKVIWAGKTALITIRDEEYNGYVNSRVAFVNKWNPDLQKKVNEVANMRPKVSGPEKPNEKIAF